MHKTKKTNKLYYTGDDPKMATGSAVWHVFSGHVRHIEAFYLKLASGLGSILNERALGKTRVTSIFWVISKMANEAGNQCKNGTSLRASSRSLGGGGEGLGEGARACTHLSGILIPPPILPAASRCPSHQNLTNQRRPETAGYVNKNT